MLRPDINLFRADLRPRTEPLTGRHLGLAVAVLVLLCAGLAALPLVDRWQLHGEHEHLAKVLAAEQLRTASFRERYSNTAPPADLLAALAQAQEDRDKTAAWLALVATEDGANRRGFSGYLGDLAQHHVPGLWLTDIRLSAGGAEVALAGMTREAAHVPLYLANLGRDTGFAGKGFRAMQMDSPDTNSGALRFLVSTKALAGSDGRRDDG